MSPTTPPPAAPGTPPPPAPVDSKHIAYLTKVQAISLTTVGIFALFSYFFHIEYFPLFDLQAAASYLFAVSWVLAVLLVLLAPTLLMPYLVIGSTLKTSKTPRRERRLSAAIIAWTLFSTLTLIGLTGSVVLGTVRDWGVGWSLLIGAALSAALFGFGIWVQVRKLTKKSFITFAKLKKQKIARRVFFDQMQSAAAVAGLQLAPLWVLLMMSSGAAGLGNDYWAFFLGCALCAIAIAAVGAAMLHVAFIPRHRSKWWIVMCSGIVLPLAISGLSQANGILPMTMAQITKIGNFRAEKLIFSPKACSSVAPVLGVDCDEKTSPPIQLCNVHIMSRIGPETYLRVADKHLDKHGHREVRHIFLPTSDITAIQVNFAVKNRHKDLIDGELAGRSSACDTVLTTLHGDSAFDFDDFTLTELGKSQLLTFIQEVKNGAAGIQEIRVTGHADQIGSPARNKWLSDRRAKEVKLFMTRYLKNLDPPIHINDSSEGSAVPMMKDCAALSSLKERIRCEAPNRRVELKIIKKAQ